MHFIPLFVAWMLPNRTAAWDGSSCKCAPTDPCWPSESVWFTFNTSLSGRLIQAVPPAGVCYPSRPEFDESACAVVAKQWNEPAFHAQDPISIDYPVWANDSCYPVFPNGSDVVGRDPNAGALRCTQGKYPVYVVNVTEAGDVKKAFDFAKKWNIRLNIKNTGHSFPGRSTAFGSLSIWTHHLKMIQFHDDFKPQHCKLNSSITQMAATVGAGVVGTEVLAALAEHNATASTGGSPTVGLVGWFTGGGHGFLSSTYGMGADNVLQAIIVTPRGDILVANECHNADIFYAIRGGGGGTFGVVIQATIKAFPTPQTTSYTLMAGLLNESRENDWWDTIASFHHLTPSLKDGGAQGYIYHVGPPIWPTLGFYFIFNFYNKPIETVRTVMKPVEDLMRSHPDYIFFNRSIVTSLSFFEWFNATVSPESVADSDGGFVSRLFTRQALNGDISKIAKMLKEVGPKLNSTSRSNPLLIGHMIANDANRGLDIGMTPAWRDAVTHFLVAESLPVGSGIKAAYADVTNDKAKTLRAFDPAAGAYINEADPFEPEWQTLFFGPNYAKLSAIKSKYDPHDLLWCRSCVGSERWVEDLQSGFLCRAAETQQRSLRSQY